MIAPSVATEATDRGGSMDIEDRVWAIRDAVLRWLYVRKLEGRKAPATDAADIVVATSWQAPPIAQDEAFDATLYLREQGYLRGQAAMGAGVLRPMITAEGERLAASKQSVRPSKEPLVANPSGVTIHNYAQSNVAVGSHGFTQTINVTASTDMVRAVADALERFAEEHPAGADRAQEVASNLRVEAEDPELDGNRLTALLGTAIGAVATAAGSEIGQQVTQLAVGAIQSLGA